MLGEATFDGGERPGPEHDLPGQLGLRPGQRAGHVVDGERVVEGVGLHVLVVEAGGPRTQAEPAQTVAIAAVGVGRGHLEQGQVPDARSP
ncbi:MAG: hypothetical protein WKF31_01785 [Thermoleophilaceae bacterium]